MQNSNTMPTVAASTKNFYPRSLFFSNLIIILLVIFFVIPSIVGKTNIGIPFLQTSTPSSYLLGITTPINSFTGKIEKINKDSLVVSNQVYQYAAQQKKLTPGNADTAQLSKTPTVTVRYTVQVNNQTTVTVQSNAPYRFITPLALQQNEPKTINDLQVGQFITATSTQDLRLANSASFTAYRIEVKPAGTFRGKITQNKGNEIWAKGTIIQQPETHIYTTSFGFTEEEKQEEAEYRFVITQNTEISNIASKIEADKLSSRDNITVFPKNNAVPNKAVEALLINQIPPPETAAPAPATPPAP